MVFEITITADAESQMRALRVREQRVLEAAILTRLPDRPTAPPRAIKKLCPDPFAEYELRVGDLRVLYRVEGSEVILLVAGWKVGNKPIVEGEEFHGHQDSPPESPGSASARNAQ